MLYSYTMIQPHCYLKQVPYNFPGSQLKIRFHLFFYRKKTLKMSPRKYNLYERKRPPQHVLASKKKRNHQVLLSKSFVIFARHSFGYSNTTG